MIRCMDEKEFNELMIHIFFSDTRAKLDSDEVTNLNYEFVQQCLGIAQEEHDTANETFDDIEIDLLEEFLKGNHKYNDQTYPVYVDWDIRKWGCESYNSIYMFNVYPYSDLSMDTLRYEQEQANEQRQFYRDMMNQLKAHGIGEQI